MATNATTTPTNSGRMMIIAMMRARRRIRGSRSRVAEPSVPQPCQVSVEPGVVVVLELRQPDLLRRAA